MTIAEPAWHAADEVRLQISIISTIDISMRQSISISVSVTKVLSLTISISIHINQQNFIYKKGIGSYNF